MKKSLSCYQPNIKMMNTKCNNSYLPSYSTRKIFTTLEHIFKVAAFMYLKPSRRSITKYIQNVLAVFQHYTTLKLFTGSVQSTYLQRTLNVKSSAVSTANTLLRYQYSKHYHHHHHLRHHHQNCISLACELSHQQQTLAEEHKLRRRHHHNHLRQTILSSLVSSF